MVYSCKLALFKERCITNLPVVDAAAITFWYTRLHNKMHTNVLQPFIRFYTLGTLNT